jgi:hypothetical protein
MSIKLRDLISEALLGDRLIVTVKTTGGELMQLLALVSKNTREGELPFRMSLFGNTGPLQPHIQLTGQERDELLGNLTPITEFIDAQKKNIEDKILDVLNQNSLQISQVVKIQQSKKSV